MPLLLGPLTWLFAGWFVGHHLTAKVAQQLEEHAENVKELHAHIAGLNERLAQLEEPLAKRS
jgi:pantothenate kinase-related protein Tda10